MRRSAGKKKHLLRCTKEGERRRQEAMCLQQVDKHLKPTRKKCKGKDQMDLIVAAMRKRPSSF